MQREVGRFGGNLDLINTSFFLPRLDLDAWISSPLPWRLAFGGMEMCADPMAGTDWDGLPPLPVVLSGADPNSSCQGAAPGT